LNYEVAREALGFQRPFKGPGEISCFRDQISQSHFYTICNKRHPLVTCHVQMRRFRLKGFTSFKTFGQYLFKNSTEQVIDFFPQYIGLSWDVLTMFANCWTMRLQGRLWDFKGLSKARVNSTNGTNRDFLFISDMSV
jgi:hypothetical protein